MEIGQKFRVHPAFLKGEGKQKPTQTGNVVWVHPKQRYAVLEFSGVHGRPREGFSFLDLLKKKYHRLWPGGEDFAAEPESVIL